MKHGGGNDEEDFSEQTDDLQEPVEIPIGDSLDLHTFRPAEIKPLLDDYLSAACAKGFQEVRIIHGKGTGQLRYRVHLILEGHPLVKSFRQAGESQGGWGATLVELKGEAEISPSTRF